MIVKPSARAEQLAERLNSKWDELNGYVSNSISYPYRNLIEKGRVEVGWRTSCGSTDKTHKVYADWKKVIAALRKDGIEISEEPVNHKNGYATNNGGFWNSIIYSITTSSTNKS